MRKLDIPYIGIKIESIPTILSVLSNAKNDEEFIEYYEKIGKRWPTIREYLHSLRNLKIAERDEFGNTRITSKGKAILADEQDLFYKNLLKHCLEVKPDIKIIKKLVIENPTYKVPEIDSALKREGYKVKRKQTLSSFLKLIHESGEVNPITIRIGKNYKKEKLEYNQFKKLLLKFPQAEKRRKNNLGKLFELIRRNSMIDLETFSNYILLAKKERKLTLYSINVNLVRPEDFCIKIDNEYYYYFEVI